MGNTQLAIIAHELLEKVRENVTIDWTIKETVRAKLRVMVRRTSRSTATRQTCARRRPNGDGAGGAAVCGVGRLRTATVVCPQRSRPMRYWLDPPHADD